jgi:hypothetical protein
VNVAAQATDALSTVVGAEWFVGADPGLGNATPMSVSGVGTWTVSASIDVRSWKEGDYTVMVRARDAAGNWSASASSVLQVQAALVFSTSGNSVVPGVSGTADDSDVYNWNRTAFGRTIDATIAPYSLPGAANVDGFDQISDTQFYLSFSGQVSVPGIGYAEDEDVLFYNGTSWSLFFDGSAHGLGGNNNLDLDAISVSGGTLYFSVLGNALPPGVTGTADDADIYSWNGSAYGRVIDVSASPYGLPAGANVDGFVRVDAAHFFLSFSSASTTVPGLGAVQDEDVLYFNAGSWSVYFDGTAHGLGTSSGLNIDAFDIP